MKLFRFACLALALAPLCLTALPQPASAQAPPSGQPAITLPAGAPPLSPAQQQKQQARLARFYQDLNALKTDTKLTPLQKQQRFAAMKKSLDQDMLAVLTPAQRKVVVKQNLSVIKLRQAFFKQHQAEITQASQLGKAYQKSFTAAQKQRLAAIQQQAQAQLQKLQADRKMSMPVKQQTAAAIIRDAQRQEQAVLTPAQQSEVKQSQAIQVRLSQEMAAYAKAHGQQ